MRDMTPPSDRSIRNIPVPANHRHTPGAAAHNFEEEHPTEHPMPKKPRRNINRWFLWSAIIVVILCAVGALLLSTLFSGATVTVSPRRQTVTPPAVVLAQPVASAGSLVYQIITTSRSASTSVAANGSQQVSKTASGVITIYNGYSTAPQKLVTNTRFAAPNGNIYKIHSAVTVPGATKAADGSLTPGSVSITAYAAAPGDNYNLGATQFSIPGFAGDPRYNKFYAQTQSISGGFVGMQAAVAPSDLQNAEALLQQSLGAALKAAAAQIPSQFVAIPGTLKIAYGDVAQSAGPSGTAVLMQSATASADIVRANDLAAAIAAQTVQGYSGEAVGFADPSALTITLASSSQSQGVLQLTLSGSPTLVWQFDPHALTEALIGKSKASFQSIVESFAPAISCSAATPCTASVRPFWSGSFPATADKITIVTK